MYVFPYPWLQYSKCYSSIIANNVIISENSPVVSCQLEFNWKKSQKNELLNGNLQAVNYIQFKLV